MDRPLLARSKRVGEGFGVQLFVDPHSGNRVITWRSRIKLRKRVEPLPLPMLPQPLSAAIPVAWAYVTWHRGARPITGPWRGRG